MTTTSPRRGFWSSAAFVGLLFLIVATLVPYGTVHPPIIALFYILVSLISIFTIISWATTKEIRLSLTPLQIPILITIAYSFIQIIPFGELSVIGGLSGIPNTISQDPFSTLSAALHFIAIYTVFALALSSFNSAGRIKITALFISLVGFAAAFFAIIQRAISPQKIYGIYEALEPFGPFVNKHNFAAFMCMAVAIPMGMVLQGAVKREHVPIYVIAIALMAVSIFVSTSRGGLVAFVAETLFLTFVSSNRFVKDGVRWPKFVLAAVFLITVAVGAALIGGETSFSRLRETAASGDFTSKRTEIWKVTADVIADGMPLGSGIGAYGAAYTKFDRQNGIERVEQAHNDYLQVLADAGLVGLGAGILFLYLLFRLGRRALEIGNGLRRGVAVGALVGIVGVLVHSVFDFVLHITAVSVLFVMLMALLVTSDEEFPDDEKGERKGRSAVPPGTVTRIDGMKRIN